MERCIICNRTLCDCKQHRDLFGSPFACQPRKRTRRYTSPNSPLSQEELDELQASIEAANDLLRSLGSPRDDENTRQLQLHFLDMRDESVTAQILCENNDTEAEEAHKNSELKKSSTISLKGLMVNAGKDFLQINQNGSSVFVLYKKILSIKRDLREGADEPEFIDANQELRRELAFHFGEFVSKEPSLINLFFGIQLYRMLKQFLGKDLDVVSPKGEFSGTLVSVSEGNIRLLTKNGELDFAMDEMCYLKVFNLK
ncbi:MAG TPA: hypothetical protein VNQ57_05305 [Ureibacillus sp.]|nr:hypothetical protein [Ureibacillus sp.]